MPSSFLKKWKGRITVFVILLLLSASIFCFVKAWMVHPVPLAGILLCDQKTERWLKDGSFLKNEFLNRKINVELAFCANAAEQKAALKRLIEKKARILVIAANDTLALQEELKQAAAIGCKIIAYDRLIQNTPHIDVFVTFNSVEVGRRMAEYVISALNPTPEKPVRIQLVGGAFNDTNTAFVHSGVLQILSPLIESKALIVPYGTNLTRVALTEWDPELARRRMDAMLAVHGIPDAVICYSDTVSQGVIQAFSGKVRGRYPLITGQDGARSAIRNILEKRQSMTVFKDPRILAKRTADVAFRLLKNVEIQESARLDNGAKKIRVLYCPIESVTKENCGDIMFESKFYTPDLKERKLPFGFLYVTDVVPDAVLDIKYAGTDNFLGVRVDGYKAAAPSLTVDAANALANAADDLRKQGYRILVYDAYRPRKAVAHFIRWVNDPSSTGKKTYYPNLTKKELLEKGYLDARSAHSRGSAIDMSLTDRNGVPLDMGGSFDLFSEQSWQNAVGLTPVQKKNRTILKNAMISAGFLPLNQEWWHFRLAKEFYPDTYFDFDVK